MGLRRIPPAEARRLAADGARLVDIREPAEFAAAHIPGAENHPLGRIGAFGHAQQVIFICRSGIRTEANAAVLAACHAGQSYLLEGGLDAWRAAGLPVGEPVAAPPGITRQVHLILGALVLLGVVLHWIGGEAWLALVAIAGAGLAFAGLTGWCGLETLLARAPWNRTTAQG